MNIKTKYLWVATAVGLVVFQFYEESMRSEVGIAVFFCVLFFYLSWICELLKKKGS